MLTSSRSRQRPLTIQIGSSFGCEHEREHLARLEADRERAGGAKIGAIVQATCALLAMMEIPIPDPTRREVAAIGQQPEWACPIEGLDQRTVWHACDLRMPITAG